MKRTFDFIGKLRIHANTLSTWCLLPDTLDEEVAAALTRGYLSSSILAVSTPIFDCFNRSLLLPLPRIDKNHPFASVLVNKMLLLYSVCSNFLVFALFFRAQALRECESCIPIEDLLAEAYGVELTVDGL